MEARPQLDPPQCMMPGRPPDANEVPTAQTSFADTPATPVRTPTCGLGVPLHCAPSQCRTIELTKLSSLPTAQASLAEIAATALSLQSRPSPIPAKLHCGPSQGRGRS